MRFEVPDDALVVVIPAAKPALKPNELDQFIAEHCELSGAVLLRDFSLAFWHWLGAKRSVPWSKLRIRRELLARGFLVKAGTANKRYVHGLTLKDAP
jgi:hypothetical protein